MKFPPFTDNSQSGEILSILAAGGTLTHREAMQLGIMCFNPHHRNTRRRLQRDLPHGNQQKQTRQAHQIWAIQPNQRGQP